MERSRTRNDLLENAICSHGALSVYTIIADVLAPLYLQMNNGVVWLGITIATGICMVILIAASASMEKETVSQELYRVLRKLNGEIGRIEVRYVAVNVPRKTASHVI